MDPHAVVQRIAYGLDLHENELGTSSFARQAAGEIIPAPSTWACVETIIPLIIECLHANLTVASMYKFSLQDFRGFHQPNPIEIRPITLLIGENSAGKSSLIAGLKYISDFARGAEEPSFNKDPFQLGTFQQIAHLRGGSAGRARAFSLCLNSDIAFREQARSPLLQENVTLTLTFANVESQAVISSIELSTESDRFYTHFVNDKIRVSYDGPDGGSYRIDELNTFPSITRPELSRYWPFLMRDLRFRIRRKLSTKDEPELPEDVEKRISLLGHCVEVLFRQWHGRTEATSAIRTKPLRTYTPGVETRDGEGSHVPFEIAKLYRSRSKDSWKKLKASLERYGHQSEMFKEISIKSFGTTASDPFQIQFSSDGPKTNIVDIGYGTSQVLPILYMVATGNPRDTYMIQQPEVHLHPKAQAALGQYFIDEYVSNQKKFIIETHSDYIVDRVRMAISSGKLRNTDVSLLFFERKRLENSVSHIELDDGGTPIDPPASYRSFFVDEQMRMLGID